MKNCTDEKAKLLIAQVVGNATSGGVPQCVMNFWRVCDHDRFCFHFYTYGPSVLDDEIRALGGEVFYIDHLTKPWRSFKQLAAHFARERYDIVHAHNTTLSCVVLAAAKKAKIPVRICHAHSTTSKHEKTAIVKYALRPFAPLWATHLAGCSEFSNRWLYGKKKGPHAFVLHNAIDCERFAASDDTRQTIRAQLGLADSFVVGHVGRWVYQKNIPFLLDYFADFATVCPQAKLVMVGSGNLENYAKERAAQLGIEDRLVMVSETERPQDYFNAFDVFALPSNYEGLPLVVVEAQAVGVPCLVSQAVTKEVDLTDHVRFLPLDKAAWAQETLQLYKEPKRYRDLEAVAQGGYDIREEVRRLQAFYEKCVGKESEQ